MATKHVQTSPAFVIVDQLSKPLPNLKAIAAACHVQANYHAGSWRPTGWGLDASVRAVYSKRVKPAQPGEIQIILVDNDKIQMENALGYHDVTEDGDPIIYVAPYLDSPDGVDASITVSHEIIETLVDSDVNGIYQDYDSGRLYAAEACDPVQAHAYDIDGIKVSNFVLPSWFAPPRNRTKTVKYDYMGVLSSAFTCAAGGWTQVLTKNGWVSIDGPQTAASSRRAAMRCAQKNGTYVRTRTIDPNLEPLSTDELVGPATGRVNR